MLSSVMVAVDGKEEVQPELNRRTLEHFLFCLVGNFAFHLVLTVAAQNAWSTTITLVHAARCISLGHFPLAVRPRRVLQVILIPRSFTRPAAVASIVFFLADVDCPSVMGTIDEPPSHAVVNLVDEVDVVDFQASRWFTVTDVSLIWVPSRARILPSPDIRLFIISWQSLIRCIHVYVGERARQFTIILVFIVVIIVIVIRVIGVIEVIRILGVIWVIGVDGRGIQVIWILWIIGSAGSISGSVLSGSNGSCQSSSIG
ncbi:uncharacterized protein BJX67DRAFT_361655 [Aspergillus lucknowensis]|uniref:Uncharacterized protein n=1 Tax=Aspergillus lucknowensis TaxID=176173 RepID=A0ABR4LI82_9EURO